MDRSGLENETIAQFWENVHVIAGIKSTSVKVKNFVNEDELLKIMKTGGVVIAGVSHSFFSKYEVELGLKPLIVPAIQGKTYIYYCVLARSDDNRIMTIEDLQGKKVSIPMYGDKWYYEKLIPGYGNKSYQIIKFPDKNSVVTAVLYKKTDAGVSSEYYLKNFFELRPHFKNKIKIVMKTKKILLPPLVYQENRLTDKERDKIISILMDAHNNDELSFLLEMIGFSSFERITREEILKAVQ